jgi:hypothetical protein
MVCWALLRSPLLSSPSLCTPPHLSKGTASSIVDVERLNELTTETCDLFLDRFPIYFEDELFQRFDEIYREKRKGLLLKSHPKLEFPLKEGTLFKRGAQVCRIASPSSLSAGKELEKKKICCFERSGQL